MEVDPPAIKRQEGGDAPSQCQVARFLYVRHDRDPVFLELVMHEETGERLVSYDDRGLHGSWEYTENPNTFTVNFNSNLEKEPKLHRFTQIVNTDVYRHVGTSGEWTVYIIYLPPCPPAFKRQRGGDAPSQFRQGARFWYVRHDRDPVFLELVMHEETGERLVSYDGGGWQGSWEYAQNPNTFTVNFNCNPDRDPWPHTFTQIFNTEVYRHVGTSGKWTVCIIYSPHGS